MSIFTPFTLFSILYWTFCVRALNKTYDSLCFDLIRNTFYCKFIFMGSFSLNLLRLYNRVNDLAEWTVLQVWLLYSVKPACVSKLFLEWLVGNFLRVDRNSFSLHFSCSFVIGLRAAKSILSKLLHYLWRVFVDGIACLGWEAEWGLRMTALLTLLGLFDYINKVLILF